MLGTHRYSKRQRTYGKRHAAFERDSARRSASEVDRAASNSSTNTLESHTRIYSCTKLEKFFHYHTACGIVVSEMGAVELRKRKKSKSTNEKKRSGHQLVYRHSKEPVVLDLCDESSVAARDGGVQECDLDMLVDDNALRVTLTETSRESHSFGQTVDAQSLHEKQREEAIAKISERHPSAAFLGDCIDRDDFGDTVDTERPAHFLSNNLADMVLCNTALSDYIVVYLVPVPELRRTRVQFYWCIRETKVPFSPLVARWMLQNYTQRCGPLERVDCSGCAPSTRPPGVDSDTFAAMSARQTTDAHSSNRDDLFPQQPPPLQHHRPNSVLEETWQEFQAEIDSQAPIGAAVVDQWVAGVLDARAANAPLLDDDAQTAPLASSEDPQPASVPLVSETQTKYRTSHESRCIGQIHAVLSSSVMSDQSAFDARSVDTDHVRLSLDAVVGASCSEHNAKFDALFADDSTTLSREECEYNTTHDIACAQPEAAKSKRRHAHLSTDELYKFSFFIEDLRIYCAQHRISPHPAHNQADSGNEARQSASRPAADGRIDDKADHPNRLFFHCALTQNDRLMIDASIQRAIQRAGFAVVRGTNAHGVEALSAQLDDAYRFSLADYCETADVQLCLGALLEQVARLEIESVEPRHLEPPLVHSAQLQREFLRRQSKVADDHVDNCVTRSNVARLRQNNVVLNAQQVSLLEWINLRESSWSGTRDYRALSGIAIGNTGWVYHCNDAEFRRNEEIYSAACSKTPLSSDTTMADDDIVDEYDNVRATKLRRVGTPHASCARSSTRSRDRPTVESFCRNALGKLESTMRNPLESRRIYKIVTKLQNTLLVSGGHQSGKRVTLWASLLLELSPEWVTSTSADDVMHQLQKVACKSSRWRPFGARESSNAERIQANEDIVQNYFCRGYIGGRRLGSIEREIALSRRSLLYMLHAMWNIELGELADESLSVSAENSANCPLRLAIALLDRCITQHDHNERLSLRDLMRDMWRSMLLMSCDRTQVLNDAGKTKQELREHEKYAHNRVDHIEQLLDQSEAQVNKHSKIVSRSTLIVCPESEIQRWLQAAQTYCTRRHRSTFGERVDESFEKASGDTTLYPDATGTDAGCSSSDSDCVDGCGEFVPRRFVPGESAWHFVADKTSRSAPINCAIYCIDDISALRRFDWARLAVTDVVIVTYECLASITPFSTHYMHDFVSTVSSIKTSSYCDSKWMRCVRQHMAIVEETACSKLFVDVNDIDENDDLTDIARHRALTQVPLEAVRWHRVVFANYDAFCRANTAEQRELRISNSMKLVHFLQTVRAVRRIFVSTNKHNADTLNRFLLPVMYASVVVSRVAEPMVPACISNHMRNWNHAFSQRLGTQSVSHLPRLFLAQYARQMVSSVDCDSIADRRVMLGLSSAKQCAQKSNLFVGKDIVYSVTLSADFSTALSHLCAQLHQVQALQALYAKPDTDSSFESLATFFSQRGKDEAFDLHRGILGYRSPSHLMLAANGTDNINGYAANAATVAAQCNAAPTHIIIDRSRSHARIVRLLDRNDPAAWSKLSFSRASNNAPDEQNTRTLKPTYRSLLQSVTHAPDLLAAVTEQLSQLFTFRVSRLLSAMVRSSSDAPEYDIALGNSGDILQRTRRQVDSAMLAQERLWNARQPSAVGGGSNSDDEPDVNSTVVGELANIIEETVQPPRQSANGRLREETQQQPFDNVGPLERWSRGESLMHSATITPPAMPDLTTLDTHSLPESVANRRDRQLACDREDNRNYERLLAHDVAADFVERMSVLHQFRVLSRPDNCTAVAISNLVGFACIPLHNVEMLSNAAAQVVGYRHAQVGLSDKCMLAICDSYSNPPQGNRTLVQQWVRNTENRQAQRLFRTEQLRNRSRSLGSTSFIRSAANSVSAADERLNVRLVPRQMWRLLCRGVAASSFAQRAECMQQYAYAMQALVSRRSALRVSGQHDDDVEHDGGSTTIGRHGESNADNALLFRDERFEAAIGGGGDPTGQSEEASDEWTFPPDHRTTARADELQTNTPSGSIACTRLDRAIAQQRRHLSSIMERYIVTEQNLLFERRCVDWTLIRMVRTLDHFVATFDYHVFLARVPLLCRLAQLLQEPTNTQHAVSDFYRNSPLLINEPDDYTLLSTEQLRALAAKHIEHYERTLGPLVEMLAYHGRVCDGALRSNEPTAQLQQLLTDVGADDVERQQLLRRVVGGVQTVTPIYLKNMIVKFHCETRWIERDLTFIRAQRKRSVAALPNLARLEECCPKIQLRHSRGSNGGAGADDSDQDSDSDSEMFECALCLDSLLTSEYVALFPCAHICCWDCHVRCNQELHQPTVHDGTVNVDIAVPNIRCFHCRYLLQADERVVKTSLGKAVSTILTGEPAGAQQRYCDEQRSVQDQEQSGQLGASHNFDDEQPDSSEWVDNLVRALVLASPTDVVNDDESGAGIAQSNQDSADENGLDDDHAFAYDANALNLRGAQRESTLHDGDLEESETTSALDSDLDDLADHSVTNAEQAEHLVVRDQFTKQTAVVSAVCGRLEMLAKRFAETRQQRPVQKLIVLSNMNRVLWNVQTQLMHCVDNEPSGSRFSSIAVDFESLPNSSVVVHDDVESLLRTEALEHQQQPVIVYFVNMNVHFDVLRGECFGSLRFVQDVDSVFFVEPPIVRLVDDRASHLLAAQLEQQLLAFFCNEFSNNRGKIDVYRFVTKYAHNNKPGAHLETVDQTWHTDTRWYKARNES